MACLRLLLILHNLTQPSLNYFFLCPLLLGHFANSLADRDRRDLEAARKKKGLRTVQSETSGQSPVIREPREPLELLEPLGVKDNH